jgi:NTP pyrophosphatase (non-canonical NTP hydrolase)
MPDDETTKLKLFDNLVCAYHVSDTTIKAWGESAQLDKTIEECAELIVALQHAKSRTLDVRAVATEIADVLVMVVCAARIVGVDIVADEMKKKLTRLKGRLETVKPQIDLEEKYREAIQRSSELESLYKQEMEKVEQLKDYVKKLQDTLPAGASDASPNSSSSARKIRKNEP